MKLIELKYENDRSTVPPYFWRVLLDGVEVDPLGHNSKAGSPYTTERHAEDMVIEIVKAGGVKDTSNLKEWHKAGYDIKKDSIEGFGNWPYRSE